MTGRIHDLIIIGGGINGAGIAREAALRGLDVVLLEADDWGSGTSSRSSMLAHGGLRYLEHFELRLVREALRERERMFRHAPHLVQPLRFIYPIYPDTANRRTVRVGMWLYDMLSRGKSVPKRSYMRPSDILQRVPGMSPHGLTGGAVYWDGQFRDVERFVLELVLDARAHGADCRNHIAVKQLIIEGGACAGVRTERGVLHARAVVNAAGPWVDDVLERASVGRRALIRKTKGAHVAVPRFTEEALIVRAKDGRTFFILPWQDVCLIGTTDTDHPDDPAHAVADAHDMAYLLQAAARFFPAAPLDDVRWTYAGVRPLVHEAGLTASSVTRRHVLHDHRREGARGLWSVQGGKLTTYRGLAEQAVNKVMRSLGKPRIRSPTRRRGLPGAPLVPWPDYAEHAVQAAIRDFGASPVVAQHVVHTYGARWRQVVRHAFRDDLKRIAKPHPHIWAEVDHAVRHEMAATLSDVLLRRLGLGKRGLRAATVQAVARRMGGLLGWDQTTLETEIQAFAKDAERFAPPGRIHKPHQKT